MPLDGLTLHLLTDELKNQITGCRIEKIYQPAKDEIIFNIRNRDGAKRLFISASSSIPRINLTNIQPENPAAPPMLCMFLRKHLTSCLITDITQVGLDRIVFIDLKGTNEIGDSVTFRLALEIMAKHSNFIVINSEGIILEAIKKADMTTSSIRQIQPGFKYQFPPTQNKINILNTDIEIIVKQIQLQTNKMLSAAILSTIEGVSPLISREIACRVTGNDISVGEMSEIHFNKLTEEISKLKNCLLNGGTPTLLVKEDNSPYDFSFTDITQYGFKIKSKIFDNYSDLIDSFYAEKSTTERTNQQSKELQKTLSNLIARSQRKLETRTKELEDCKDKDSFRINAELILANQYSLQKGSLYFDVQNFYDNYNLIRIKADPALSPAQNAQKYFKEYNKKKNAEKLLDNLIEESKIEIKYLESVLDAVKRSSGFSEISEIKSELYDEGYLKRTSKSSKKQKALPPIKYISDDGYVILAGRNNIQNEMLSLKSSDKSDSWFHTQSYPGSHVVVIGNGDIIPERTCRQAAVIAAYNSAAKDSSQVAVDYTEIRELKKPKNGKKGMVIYHTYNTMWVKPDKELCDRLKAR